MKRIVYIGLVFSAMVVAVNGAAQITFDQGVAEIKLNESSEQFGYIELSNNVSHDINHEWKLLKNTLNPGWKIQFCECTNCYTNEFAPLDEVTDSGKACGDLQTDASLEWYMGIKLNGEPASVDSLVVEVFNVTDNIRDTLKWKTSTDSVSTSVAEQHSLNEFDVFPNPVAENATLTFAQGVQKTTTISIENILGSRVYSQQVEPGVERLQLNLDDLKEGVYFLNVQSVEGIEQTKKLVIRR